MRLFSVLFLFNFLNSICYASYTVMTFNTMCDFCSSNEYADYNERITFIKSTVDKYAPDLISLQELRTISQVNKVLSSELYEIIATENALFSYADPALGVRKDKFEILDKGQFWLGPGEGLSWGWKFALPRQVHWVKVKDKLSKKSLYFIGSHFDNRNINRLGSANKLQEFVKSLSEPFIFAADSNIKVESEFFSDLIGSEFLDTFELVENFKVTGQKKYDQKDLCYRSKSKGFPGCRVDHILVSKSNNWKVIEWTIDLTQFGKDNSYASDHRAIVSKIILN